MRQIVVGLSALALMMTAGIAQAGRPGDYQPGGRPNDFGGGRAGSVVAASNPYRNTEAMGLVRGQQRMMQKTNFHASTPADNQATREDRLARHASSGGSGHGALGGGVRAALNPYRNAEAMGLARGQQRAAQKTNFHASTPAEPGTGRDQDHASKEMRAMASGGGLSTGGGIRAALNPFRNAEAMGIARGKERALQKTNQGASQPADPNGGRDLDHASREMKAMSNGGGAGVSGGVRYGLNPFTRLENTGVAKGIARLQAKANFAGSPSGLKTNASRPLSNVATVRTVGARGEVSERAAFDRNDDLF
jgi:hypothetical protein